MGLPFNCDKGDLEVMRDRLNVLLFMKQCGDLTVNEYYELVKLEEYLRYEKT